MGAYANGASGYGGYGQGGYRGASGYSSGGGRNADGHGFDGRSAGGYGAGYDESRTRANREPSTAEVNGSASYGLAAAASASGAVRNRSRVHQGKEIPQLKVGDTVRHTKFGEGRVLALEGTGDKTVAKVRFCLRREAFAAAVRAVGESLVDPRPAGCIRTRDATHKNRVDMHP